MSAGVRTRLHNELRNSFAAIARLAFLAPVLEPQPFSTTPHKGKRLDVAYIMGDSIHLVDVAITHSVQQYAIAAACDSPGGAATSYQRVKEDKYLPAIAAEPAFVGLRMTLVPLVLDTYGAIGEKGAAELAQVISALQRRRTDMPATTVSQVAFHRLLFGAMQGVARILLANSTCELGEVDLDRHLPDPMETREGSASTARSDRHSSPPSPSADSAPNPWPPDPPPTPPEDAISNSRTTPITEPGPSPETFPSPTPPEALPSSNCPQPEPETPTTRICPEQLQSDSPKAKYPKAVTDQEGAETGARTLDFCEVSRPGVLDASSPGVALLLGEGEGGTDELRGNGHRRAGDIQDSKVLLEEQVQGEEACGSEFQPVPASRDESQATGQSTERVQSPVQLRAPEGTKRRRSQDREEEGFPPFFCLF